MSMPQTLKQMAGRPMVAATFEDAALMMIDCQKEYETGKLPLDGIDQSIAQITKLQEIARKTQVPLIHIQHYSQGVFEEGQEGSAFIGAVKPLVGEAVFQKRLPNSFSNEELHPYLQKLGIKKLIVCGYMTHVCVSTTVRMAHQLGYQVIVVKGATGTRDLPTPNGEVLKAENLQLAVLTGLNDVFAQVIESVDDLGH